MTSVPYILNKYVAPFVLGFSVAALSVSSDAVAISSLVFVVVGVGFFSLPKAGRLIERCFSAVARARSGLADEFTCEFPVCPEQEGASR